MNVLVVEPGVAPYEKEINGLTEMQATVGGLIDAIYPFEDRVAVVCNDEALFLDMEFNRSMPGGTAVCSAPFLSVVLQRRIFVLLHRSKLGSTERFFTRLKFFSVSGETSHSR